MKIRIIIGKKEILAELNETETAKKIYEALPIESPFNTWGEEIYFEIPVKCRPENPRADVEAGELGYWLEGSCFCIFYGRTPASKNSRPRAASPVNVFGKIIGNVNVFKTVSGNKISVERA